MSDNNENLAGANGAPPAGNPPADAGKPAAGAEPAAPSHRDWNALASNLRELTSTVKILAEMQNKGAVTAAPVAASKPDPKPQSAPEPVSGNGDAAMARIQELERNLALRDAFLEHGISDPEARELIAAKVRLDNASDVGVVVAKYAAKFKPVTAPVTQPVAEGKPQTPAVSAGTANAGGVGGAPARVQQPNDILAIDPAAWSAMSPAEKKAAYEKQVRKSSGNYNPFAEGRTKK